ncbi:uncharacterized protein LOC113312817 [Papaver somniferum]|uniref:uncharacterized protein LOC113312817 n=1 Tax=Papaver somniferum TaxID=3469 RepID=UPI000E6F6944|nr:uncharacterized protein LOC113312817 [Papaver somniferum]
MSASSIPPIYLGVQFKNGKTSSHIFDPLLQRLARKAQGWMTKCLNQAGRNDLIFKQHRTNPDNILALTLQQQQEFEWAKQVLPQVLPGHTPSRAPPTNTGETTTILAGWTRPDPDWIKINTNGDARGHPGMTGAGFICRDSTNQTAMALAQPLGITTALIAETWGILLASRTAIERQ